MIEIRTYIKDRSLLGLKSTDIHHEVSDIYGEGQCRIWLFVWLFVCWLVDLSRDTSSWKLKDAAHTCRLATTRSKHKIERIRLILKKDTRDTVRQLARTTNLPVARVHWILNQHLGFSKINARWIPPLLTDDQKRSRVEKAKLLFIKPKYSKKTLDNLVTGDETWVYFFEPKRKCSYQVWATRNAKRSSIVKRIRTVRKVLYLIFFDNKDPVCKFLCRKFELSQVSPI